MKTIARSLASTRRLGRGGYTLIELIVAVGVFALIMTLASGAYLIMISVNRQAQSTATGINNLAFVLESLTRNVRTGTAYTPISASSFSFTNQDSTAFTYSLGTQPGYSGGTVGALLLNGAPLTDPLVDITSLTFTTSGTASSDTYQPYVTITLSGTVSVAPGKTQSFSVETSAAMRGSDIGGSFTLPPPPTTTTIFLTSGSSWIVPAGVTKLTSVEAIGGGSGGSRGLNTSISGGGGGGGAYAKVVNLSVIAGGSISYTIGAGGSDGRSGGDTQFKNSSTLVAKGANGQSGGSAALSVGSTKNDGGSGGGGTTKNPGAEVGGGGGGGAGGPNGAGRFGGDAPSGQTSGAGGGAGDNGSGGSGGSGGSNGSPGLAGDSGAEWDSFHGSGGGGGGGSGTCCSQANGGGGGSYGAGGGGVGTGNNNFGTGGDGAQGIIVITYMQ